MRQRRRCRRERLLAKGPLIRRTCAAARWLCIGLSSQACSLVNAFDACDEQPSERRVNERGDLTEFVAGPGAAAGLDTGRLLVSWAAQSEDEATSEVRYGMYSPTGEKVSICSGSAVEKTFNAEGAYAMLPSASVADLDHFGDHAAAALAWTERLTTDTNERRSRVLFLDAAGCGVGSPGSFSPFSPEFENVGNVSIGWSARAHTLLAIGNSTSHVVMAHVTQLDWGPTTELGGSELVYRTAFAIGPQGDALVAWSHAPSLSRATANRVSFGAALLDEQLEKRKTFEVTTPIEYEYGSSVVPPHVGVAAGKDRFAITVDGATQDHGAPTAYVLEVDGDGHTLAPARKLELGDRNCCATPLYLADGSLFVSWLSAEAQGSVGLLVGPDGRERFTSVGCKEGPFVLGSRNPDFIGQPSPLLAGDTLHVLHTATTPTDPLSTAVLDWFMPAAQLWPVAP
ncbi:MAG TPA: hypothetical protein VHB79_36175 [Polyangiaceae bacterium]|nr:hypothetical protein [Polyangiaceae bacterium]